MFIIFFNLIYLLLVGQTFYFFLIPLLGNLKKFRLSKFMENMNFFQRTNYFFLNIQNYSILEIYYKNIVKTGLIIYRVSRII